LEPEQGRSEQRLRIVGELRALREQVERARLERNSQRLGCDSSQRACRPAVQRVEEGREASGLRMDAFVEARQRFPRPTWLTTAGCINVAVTGNAGVGKSSFINSARGLRATDPGAADVSPNETTMEPTGYDIPELPAAAKLWDLPGAGTRRVPRDSYVRAMGLRYFDVVIVVTASRYTETEIAIAEELRAFAVPYFMVRNKVDADVVNNEDDHGTPPEVTLASIYADMQRQGVERPYLISSKFSRRMEFDMEQLKADAFVAICNARDVPQDFLSPCTGVGGSAAAPPPSSTKRSPAEVALHEAPAWQAVR